MKKLGVALLLTGVLISPAQAETVTYLHTDLLGSVVLETDQNRNVVQRYEYEPYGLPRQAIADAPGYTGHVHDAGSGLVYMQQRYYDPEVGRFLSVDPVGVETVTGGNFNRYWYGNNNPYTYTDPDGQLAFLIPMAAGAIIGAVINTGAQIARAEGSLSERFSQVDPSQVAVAAVAGALGGGAGVIAGTAATTGGTIGANVVAGGAIGAGAVHANAALDGTNASAAEVAKGAVLAAGLSGVASGVAAAPSAASRAATATLSQTERVATGNLIEGVANTTRSGGGSANFAPAGQGAATSAAATISNADNFSAQPRNHDASEKR